MNNPSPTDPHTNDDLASADALSFLAANGLQPDPAGNQPDAPKSAKGLVTLDDKITQAVTSARAVHAQSHKPRRDVFYVAAAVIVAIVIVLGTLISLAPKNTAGNNNLLGGLAVPTPASSDTNGLGSQAQQDIKTCSNPINAVLGAC